ncbi:MAG: hypothetical protein J7M24_05670, partial [Candidatus Latescibacteria bacterium]|nr:hypothetical protein [Candidatus Latescibacterota bacterium]
VVTYLAGSHGIEQLQILKAPIGPEGSREYRRILDEFALEKNLVAPLFLSASGDSRPKAGWRLRDRCALEHADIVCPVSIRPGGRLDTLLAEFAGTVDIRDDFRIPWELGKRAPLPDYSSRDISPSPPGDWLVHWTRSSAGPWPGEKAWEFYRDVLKHPGALVRSAEETLVRILTEKRIAGSTWRLPRNATAVSFSSLEASEAIHLMRWRKRFVRFSFEPYGVAVRVGVLLDRGARPVEYIVDDAPAASSDKRIFQHAKGALTDWESEREWRIGGDVDLAGIDAGSLLAVVPDIRSAGRIRAGTGDCVPVHVLFSGV